MILNPLILSLLLSSVICGLFLVSSLPVCIKILLRWNIKDGSESQLQLERKTFLVSEIIRFVLAIEVLSLFLFIYIADSFHIFFSGAMCATGTLSVNRYGFIVLFLKLILFFVSGIWIIVNQVDNSGYDYPLIRVKYWILLLLVPLAAAELIFELFYFTGLRPDIITSCCGSLFSSGSGKLASDISSVSPLIMTAVHYMSIILLIVIALGAIRSIRLGYIYSALSVISGILALTYVISVLSLYIYNMPSHHCPFCILQKEYHYTGYLIYALILTGTVCGGAAGVLMPFRNARSISNTLPSFIRKLIMSSLILFVLFAAVSAVIILKSDLKLLSLF